MFNSVVDKIDYGIDLYKRYKGIINFILLLSLIVAGFISAHVWLISGIDGYLMNFKTDSLFFKILDIEGKLVKGFLVSLLPMLLIVVIGLYLSQKNHNDIRLINITIKIIPLFIVLPHKYFALLYSFSFGFCMYVYYYGSSVALPLFLVVTILFGLPYVYFKYYVKNMYFNDAEYLSKNIGLVIAILVLSIALIVIYLIFQNLISIIDWFSLIKNIVHLAI